MQTVDWGNSTLKKFLPRQRQIVEEVWSSVHNAGRKPTAGSRPVKWR